MDFRIDINVNVGFNKEDRELLSSLVKHIEAKPEAKESTQELEEPEPEAKAEETPKVYTEEDIREAMHRTRQRIEGEDYRDNTGSEAYKKYHKALTSEFKALAALQGAEKPSAIKEENRYAFICACDDLRILDDGTIGGQLPF